MSVFLIFFFQASTRGKDKKRTDPRVRAQNVIDRMSSPLFTINEIFVCLHEKDGSKFPYSAKIMMIKEIGGIQYYLIHYRGWKSNTDIRIPVGEEAGRMFKGSLEEYGKKFHVAISPDAWEAERKCKRKATDDLDRSC
ncbi:unnamed protein product [Caenorhabditis nigoni]